MSTSVTNLLSFSRPCPSCKEINLSDGKCENCQNRDGEEYSNNDLNTDTTSRTPGPDATLAVRRKFALLNETSKAYSSGSSVDEAQKDAADMKFRLTNKHLKLPIGTKTCCITLQFEPGAATEICHIVARKNNMSSQQLRKLEFLWGIDYKGFHVDSSTNLLRMSASLHRAFDEGSWALVPYDTDIVSRMLHHYLKWEKVDEMTQDLYQKHRFDEVNCYKMKRSFKYFIIPLKSPRFRMPIVRLNLSRFEDRPPTEAEVYYFPYDQFPVLDLPLEPHYVIWNLGTKFKEQNIDAANYLHDPALHPLARYYVVFNGALQVFAMWDNINSPPWFGPDDGVGNDGGDNDGGNDEADDGTCDVGGSSRGRQKRRRTEKSQCSSDDGRRAAPTGADAGDEAMGLEPDAGSSDEESSDEDKVDFIESEEALALRVEGWRGGVVIDPDDGGDKSVLVSLEPGLDYDYLSEPTVQSTPIAPEVI